MYFYEYCIMELNKFFSVCLVIIKASKINLYIIIFIYLIIFSSKNKNLGNFNADSKNRKAVR